MLCHIKDPRQNKTYAGNCISTYIISRWICIWLYFVIILSQNIWHYVWPTYCVEIYICSFSIKYKRPKVKRSYLINCEFGNTFFPGQKFHQSHIALIFIQFDFPVRKKTISPNSLHRYNLNPEYSPNLVESRLLCMSDIKFMDENINHYQYPSVPTITFVHCPTVSLSDFGYQTIINSIS